MRIGLVRHFRVDIKKNRFMTSEGYNKYSHDYDFADVIPNEVVIDKDWDKCYCSILPRAMKTARTIYHGDIIPTDKLREIPSAAAFKFKFFLPYNLWAILNRLVWSLNRPVNPEGKSRTSQRINEIMDTIFMDSAENILIVSHAGTMYEIERILRRKGFKGPFFFKPRNGKLYIYEKK
ncbi:MAG: histidine phosphatase family protein [Bacillota bacterium]|nr:histidine phosphatase family protein [Bacillota bacterium]